MAGICDQLAGIGGRHRRNAQWEAKARKNGYGNLRYKGFRTSVQVVEATGRLQGLIINPEARPVRTVSAATAAEFVREMRRRVNEYLTRQ